MFGMNLENKAGAICTHSVRKTNQKKKWKEICENVAVWKKISSKFIIYLCSILNNFQDFELKTNRANIQKAEQIFRLLNSDIYMQIKEFLCVINLTIKLKFTSCCVSRGLLNLWMLSEMYCRCKPTLKKRLFAAFYSGKEILRTYTTPP